ncbi:MAG: hypothetical protein LIP12_05220 [Clostridiales bacterium]|nr:hypothetical protein [Clostridiales bacterium]
MYRNSEGYYDPTAGMAMSQAMKEYRSERKKVWSRQYGMKNRTKIYVVSPYSGDIAKNTAAAIRYCHYVINKGMMPVASHLLYPQVLDDDIPEEREMGLMFGLSLLALCNEVWVFGSRISSGMEKEIAEANRLNKPVRYISEEAMR